MTTTPRKPTRQQAAVADLLDKCDDFTSAQTVHARLREAGAGVGLATVYRTLQAMVEAGTVDMLRTDDGDTRIEGELAFSTFAAGGQNPEFVPVLQQAGVRYSWDGQEAYGMMERSIPVDKLEG